MDPRTDLPDQIEDLECNIDDLESTLAPLLSTPLSQTASSLPLLDKAKFYVLTAYSIESILFSTLQASGANAKEHAIFQELARLKGYFAKIKNAEEVSKGPKTKIDTEAAARFIRHGLAGNEKYDLERAERIAKEKARAALKAKQMHIKFDQAEEHTKQISAEEQRPAAQQSEEQEQSSHVESENEDFYGKPDTTPGPNTAPTPTTASQKDKKSKKESKKRKHATEEDRRADKATRRARKQKHRYARPNKDVETILPTKAPKTHSETFNALLDGSFQTEKQGKEKGKGKGKGK